MMLPLPSVILAIVSRTTEAVKNLRYNWEHVIPNSFPPKHTWLSDFENGVALYGNVTRENKSLFAIVTERVQTNELSINSVSQKLSLLGEQALGSLPDSFALFHWDLERQTFIAARDAFGKMEVFCLETPSYFLLSSDISLLLAASIQDIELNYEAAVHFLLFGLPPIGNSLARNIKKLPAGQYYESLGGGLLVRKRFYSPLSCDASRILSNDQKNSLVDSLDGAIRKAIGSGKQALLLSGGVDSSYLAYSMAKAVDAKRLDAYSVEFEQPYPDNETHYARAVAKDAGLNFRCIFMTAQDATQALEIVLKSPQPASAFASLTHVHLAQNMLQEGHQVFCSGLGADEVFGGYSRFLHFYRRWRFYEDKYSKTFGLDPFDSLLIGPHLTRLLFPGVPEFFSLADFRKASRKPFKQWNPYIGLVQFYRECRELKPDAQFIEMMIAHECQHRIPDLLFTSFESISRVRGISGRYPFLEKDIVNIACGLGAVERFWLQNRRWKNKRLLREVASARIPEVILNRPIGIYTTPIALWLQNKQFAEIFRPLIMEGKLWETDLISKAWRADIDKKIFKDADLTKRELLQSAVNQAWVMATLAAWYENWVY